ncbi:membrane dipeptidase [Pseudomonas aeruginosa]|nr:membrane dipeptidase [Pseudomonas aeruginosa]
MFGFNYVGNNDWSDSSRPLPFFNDTADAPGGLSPLGKQAVERPNDLGVIIDVSQMSTKAPEQVAALSRAPIVASHPRRAPWWTSSATSATTRCN